MKTIPITSPKLNEVSIVYTRPRISELPCVKSSQDASDLIRSAYAPGTLDHRELFYAMYLNSANLVLALAKISEGGLNQTMADIRIVFQIALKVNATELIIAHNHPSGNLKYSSADLDITKRIAEVGNFLCIPLIDHIILTSEGYFSFADEKII